MSGEEREGAGRRGTSRLATRREMVARRIGKVACPLFLRLFHLDLLYDHDHGFVQVLALNVVNIEGELITGDTRLSGCR